jgi:acetyl esterase/lipase
MERKRPAVIMCPGGAYWMRSDREAEPVALHLMAADICVFLIEYAVQPAVYPLAVTQLAAAVAYVRDHADKYHVKADKISVMGYSAGGHLAASLGVRWQEPWLSERLGRTPADIQPNGMVLCYPVITTGPFAHIESMENITGCKRDKPSSLWEHLSLEKQVSADTPPTCLWHTVEDPNVPVENSLLFATALRAHHVPFELHIYQKGGHGLSLGNKEVECKATRYPNQPNIRSWIRLLRTWLERDEY